MMRTLIFLLILSHLIFTDLVFSQTMDRKAVMVLHGGAGVITREKLSKEQEEEYRKTMAKVLQAGYKLIKKGASAEEVVVATMVELEDSPLFNAGRGSVLNDKGFVEMDASIMTGQDLGAGAVAGLTRIKNPILAAQGVKNQSSHVFLAGEGADAFGESLDLAVEAPEYFITERRRAQFEERKKKKTGSLDQSVKPSKYGTVGVVAVDKEGNLCAGTSTGGTSNKLPGRIGDSPLIGAGTYAANASCAVSCTGAGEYFIRALAARSVAYEQEKGEKDLNKAIQTVIEHQIAPLGGDGGAIAIDAEGNYGWGFNTPGMYRGVIFEDGVMLIKIYED